MRALTLILMFFSFSYADQYTFLVDKYDKEIELEAKILFKIATVSAKKDITLFIPEITPVEAKVYGKFFTLTSQCQEANFIFINKTTTSTMPCDPSGKLFFTNNYKKLLSDTKFFGAFFWAKSRPNIVFLKKRLTVHNIALPKEYYRYVEEFDAQ
ncbi:MAG: hypothetical protein IBX45_05390 [Campylobacterales bacterium]|nr:hypothetical protein [Campylobacterales bacterium]